MQSVASMNWIVDSFAGPKVRHVRSAAPSSRAGRDAACGSVDGVGDLGETWQRTTPATCATRRVLRVAAGRGRGAGTYCWTRRSGSGGFDRCSGTCCGFGLYCGCGKSRPCISQGSTTTIK